MNMIVNRGYSFALRFPWQFIGLGNGWIKATKIWFWHSWSRSNMCDIWLDSGFRFLGVEVNKREWLIPKKER